ncbi:MAG: serine hydrolase [Eubacteriales bacterium]
MFKKSFIMVLIILLFSNVCVLAEIPSYPEDRGVLLYEVNSDQMIIEHNIDKKFYPASTTKIMTAILVVEYLFLEQQITVGSEISSIPSYSSTAELQEGEVLKVEELLYALMLPSGNDAANVFAVQVARKVSGNQSLHIENALAYFASLMNQKAKDLGASHTHFLNPHGLHHPNHYTTPEDMLKITKELLMHDILKKVIQTTEYHVTSNKQTHDWYNTNVFLQERWDDIPHADRKGINIYYNTKVDGIKTGTTTPAGRCVIFSSHNGNLDLIGIIYHSTLEELWQEGTDLMNYAFDNYAYVNFTYENKEVEKIYISNGKNGDSTLSVISREELALLVEKESEDNILMKTSYIDKFQPYKEGYEITGDISKNDRIGTVQYYINGEVVVETALYASHDMQKRTFYDFLFRWYSILLILLLFIGIQIMRVQNKRRKKRKIQRR